MAERSSTYDRRFRRGAARAALDRFVRARTDRFGRAARSDRSRTLGAEPSPHRAVALLRDRLDDARARSSSSPRSSTRRRRASAPARRAARASKGSRAFSCSRAGAAKTRLLEREDYAACCCAAQNLMLYLWQRGVGVKWTTGGITRQPRFYDLLGIDASKEVVVGFFWYGVPKVVPTQKRKSVAEIVTERP